MTAAAGTAEEWEWWRICLQCSWVSGVGFFTLLRDRHWSLLGIGLGCWAIEGFREKKGRGNEGLTNFFIFIQCLEAMFGVP